MISFHYLLLKRSFSIVRRHFANGSKLKLRRTTNFHISKYRKLWTVQKTTRHDLSKDKQNLRNKIETDSEISSKASYSVTAEEYQDVSLLSNDPGLNPKLLISKDLLIQHLCDNILYQDDYVVAINKPSGLPMSGTKATVDGGEIALTVSEILPDLRQRLGAPELQLVLPMSRGQTGGMVFSKTVEAQKRMVKRLKTAQVQKHLFQTYLALCVGIPSGATGHAEDFYVSRQKVGQLFMSYPVENPTNKSRERGETIQCIIQANILSVSEDHQCSLVRLRTNRDKWNCLDVFLTTLRSPILGDHIYSSRVSTVLGTPMYIDPQAVYPAVQNLPDDLLQKLGINTKDRKTIPLCLHREEVVITNFPNKRAPNCIIRAPPPSYFLKAMKRLFLAEEGVSSETNT